MMITSRKNPVIGEYRRLAAERAYRAEMRSCLGQGRKLLDEDRSTLYCGKEDTFQPLANYGITTDDPNGLRIYVGDKPLMKDLGDYAYYASLSDWTVSGKGSKAMTQAAVNALQVILNTGE